MDPTSKETRFAFFLFFDEALKDKYIMIITITNSPSAIESSIFIFDTFQNT